MDIAHANQLHFNEQAAKYNTDPWQLKLSAQITEFIQSNLDFISCKWCDNVRMLDYACGTGVVTQAFAGSIDTVVGIDISSAMIERYKDTLSETKNKHGKLLAPQARVGDLFSDTPDESSQVEEFHTFDLAVVGLGFHHFPSHILALQRLAERLKGGGVLLILDFTPENELLSEEERKHRHDVSASGFAESDMADLFEKAGLKDVKYNVMEEPVEMHRPNRTLVKKVFMARAVKQ